MPLPQIPDVDTRLINENPTDPYRTVTTPTFISE